MVVLKICFIFMVTILNVNSQNPFNFPNNYQQCQDNNSGKFGVCKYFAQCPKVKNDYYNRRIQPTICWFEGVEPIVCCVENNKPSIPETNTQKNQPLKSIRISELKCQDYYVTPLLTSQQNVVSLVGGLPTKLREFPFMVALGWSTFGNEVDFNCGGFLVSPNFVITVAHCANIRGAPPKYVRIGGDNLTLSYGNIEVERIWIHPKYNAQLIYNDIALIKLKNAVNKTPACLQQTKNIESSEVTAIGYGHTQFAGRRSDQLLKISLKLFKNERCQQYFTPTSEFPKGIIKTQVCAGDPNKKKDTCQGDSGGPILYHTSARIPYVVGLTSFGQGCAGEAPSIYTRISSYLDWIEPIVWPTN